MESDDGEGCTTTATGDIFNGLYYWGRIASIAINVSVFVLISIKMHYMNIDQRSRNPILGGHAINPSAAIGALVRRLKYYPIVQVLVRR